MCRAMPGRRFRVSLLRRGPRRVMLCMPMPTYRHTDKERDAGPTGSPPNTQWRACRGTESTRSGASQANASGEDTIIFGGADVELSLRSRQRQVAALSYGSSTLTPIRRTPVAPRSRYTSIPATRSPWAWKNDHSAGCGCAPTLGGQLEKVSTYSSRVSESTTRVRCAYHRADVGAAV
jgi:hypothetical protein